jgi:hypothetical protein
MVFQRSETPLVKVLSPRRTIPIGRDCEMASYKKRLVKRLFVADNQRVRRVEFLMNAQAHVVSFQFNMNLNHKQCNNTIAAVTKITRRISMHKTQ